MSQSQNLNVFANHVFNCRDVVVITIAQLHSAKLELKFWAGSTPVRGVLEIFDSEDL